jgi:small ligand-binding sensory domain FIST
MRWAASLSVEPQLERAVEDTAAQIQGRLHGERADLVVAFVSGGHMRAWARLPGLIHEALPGAMLIGCSAGGVIGDGHEIEDGPALSLTAARLPGVELRGIVVDEDGRLGDPSRWRRRFELEGPPAPHLIVLPDPFSCDAPALISALDAVSPAGVKLGGLASGGTRPGENALFLGTSTHRRGAVALALRGNLEIDTVVAQGCRPVGQPMFVTRRRDNLVLELDGRNANDVVQELFLTLPPEDRALAQHSLFLGLAMSPDGEAYGHGDFLIRNLIGIEPSSGGLGVGARLRDNIVVQFHVRDAATSAADLDALLAEARLRHDQPPAGALLFSCLGRGEHLYGSPDHDSRLLHAHLGPIPMGGFFCNGEIGPVHGATFLHGYTSALGLFSAPPTQ